MKFSVLAFFASMAAVLADIAVEEGVLVLTDENFDEAIKTHEKMLVEFYAPWCGHCKQLAPEYAKAATKLEGEGSAFKLAKVDATEEKDVASKFKISGFPTIKYFNAGSPTDYSGGRTEADILSWVAKKSGPPAATISSEDEYTEAVEANEVFVMGVFGDSESAAAKLYLSVASGDENNVYKITTAAAVKSKLGITADTVVVIKQYDEGRNDLNVDGATDGAAISSFINGNVVPLINVYTREKAAKIFSSPVKVHGLFFTDADEDSHKTVTEEVRSIAGNHKGEVLFVNIPGSESGILEYFGMKKTDLPAFILADMGGGGSMKKYPYTGAMKGEQISAHITAFTSGKLKPSLKSEEPTAADLEGDVAVLKGKSFNEVVMDNTKDVLVEFYAPWCGHCKKLAPIYDELGAKLADNDNVVIAKMDSTANEIDVEGVNVSGFPTLYWFKGNDKANPVLYQGGRDLESFLAYIKENAHNEVSHEEL